MNIFATKSSSHNRRIIRIIKHYVKKRGKLYFSWLYCLYHFLFSSFYTTKLSHNNCFLHSINGITSTCNAQVFQVREVLLIENLQKRVKPVFYASIYLSVLYAPVPQKIKCSIFLNLGRACSIKREDIPPSHSLSPIYSNLREGNGNKAISRPK